MGDFGDHSGIGADEAEESSGGGVFAGGGGLKVGDFKWEGDVTN